MLAKTNQAVTTLETYRARFDQVSTRLTALEFQGAVMLDDVLGGAPARRDDDSRMRPRSSATWSSSGWRAG